MTARRDIWALWLGLFVAGCGGGGGGGGGGGSGPDAGPQLSVTIIDVPSLEQIVRDSAPSAFTADSAPAKPAATTGMLDPQEFRARFFMKGPTNALDIMHNVDARLSFFRQTASDNVHVPCADQTPVEFNTGPVGQMKLYIQCYQMLPPNGLILWGQKDGSTYLYLHQDIGGVVAIARPAGPAPTADGGVQHYTAEIWSTIGENNQPWHSGSYGIMHIQGNSATSSFEMAVAGVNMGFCGAQIRSDGSNVYGEGSADGPSCADDATLCTTAGDLSKSGVCSSTLKTFNLPALGRKSFVDPDGYSANVSFYPSSANVIINGTNDWVHGAFSATVPSGITEYSIIRLMPMPDAGVVDARGIDAHL
jgi:hypothetical protein